MSGRHSTGRSRPMATPKSARQLTAAFAPIWQMLSLVGECRDRVERMLATRPPDIHLSQRRRSCACGSPMTFAHDDIRADRTHSRCTSRRRWTSLRASMTRLAGRPALHAMVSRVHVWRPRRRADRSSAARRSHIARRRRHEVGGRPYSRHLPALCRQVGPRAGPPPARGRPLCRPLGRASLDAVPP